MKAIKIVLAVIVVVTIGFFVWMWVSSKGPGTPPVVKPPSNPFTARIEHEIDSLGKAPANVFCKDFYQGIEYRITDYHKQNLLGNTSRDNDQWQDILSKNLYSAYAPKFADQALYVFKGSEWLPENLRFIRSEVNELQNSPYLQRESSVYNSFRTIHVILSKYDEIAGFISSCSNFLYSDYDLGSSFPLNDVSGKIQKSRTYVNNRLGNNYVNNCTRLKNGLREIPQNLFNKHVSYLRSKIQQNSGKYQNYRYQSDYSKEIYTPLKSQLEALDNGIYSVSESIFNENYSYLETSLSVDNHKAVDYFNSNNN